MHVTELLITCFDGQELVSTVFLDSDTATIHTTSTDESGETVVDAARQEASDAFEAIWKILERLIKVYP
jgi:acyl CoA:acetate/3-ketoacid CoA transferase alpha subunit